MALDSEVIARQSRISTLNMITNSKSSHLGSSLSVIDILSVLYTYKLNNSRQTDSILLSKGHASAALYSILGNCGLIPISDLESYCEDGSSLGGHVTHYASPYVEFSTGSLGHALSIGAGKALGRISKHDQSKIYVIMSDGELDEGSTWEAALFASHHRLSNLCVLVDRNGLQSIKSTEATLKLEPIDEKFKAFGWDVSLIDGHCHKQILSEISMEKIVGKKPKVIICNTVKGKGISFMENKIEWHYKYPNMSQYLEALKELNSKL